MACDICKELLACPMGSRRRVVIAEAKHPKFIDQYGRHFVSEDPLMTIDKYPSSVKCFIRQSYCDENSVHYDFRIDGIKFCPFCGEYLLYSGEDQHRRTVTACDQHGRAVIVEYAADGSFTEYVDEMEE